MAGALAALVSRLSSGSGSATLVMGDGRASEGLLALSGAGGLATFTDDAPAEASAQSAATGGLPARYTSAGLLGVGGMGEVLRVRDRELGRTCAFKSIKPELLGKANVLARFVEEAQIGAQLQHPNIPPVYDGGRLADGRPWFTMKEVRGRTLGELIADAHGGEWTESGLHRLCEVLVSVADAVGYAHGRGVVHRDLKPDNVQVGSFGEVYVLDWGLAKVVGRPDLALAEGDGSGKRARALEVVARAEATVGEAADLRARAADLRAEGAALLAGVPTWAPEEDKAAGWTQEDAAAALELSAGLLEAEREALLQASLTHAPELPEAHAALAALAEGRHAAAEAARDAAGAKRAEARLRAHAEALPDGHAVRRRVAAYLQGDGALTLETDPPGAEVHLSKYELRNRRLVAVPVGVVGRTPLRGVPLPMGSYLGQITHPERSPVRYPVSIGRG